MKLAIALVVAVVVIFGGSWFVVDAAFKHDAEQGEKFCSSLNAEKVYIEDGHYLCVDPEGRVVGRT